MDKRNFAWLGLLTLLAGLLAACGATAPAALQAERQTLDLQDCRLAAPGTNLRVNARCATLTVFEDRTAQSGRTIDLHIAVLPAVSRNPAPDPLFLLAGGPGQAATEAFVPTLRSLDRINQQRDIVLVDQRGTGKSNPLRCPVATDETNINDAALTAWAQECAGKLNANLSLYTTPIAMADLDQVRAALGYDKINLLGVSYGTRAALTYLRLYPDRVRTITLDGIIPQEEPLGATFARDGQRALDLMFERCAADTACNGAFPNLKSNFEALMTALAQQPVEVTLDDPFTGKPVTRQLTRDQVALTVQTLSYTPESVALLPLLLHMAQVERNYKPLAAQLLIVQKNLSESINAGMRLSVMCAEDVPFYPAAGAATNDNRYLGDYFIRQFSALCAGWPRGELPGDYKTPITSNVPALLLSGEADPVTTPEFGERVAGTLPNSLHLVAPGQAHNVFCRGCAPRILASFIDSGSVDGLQTECLQESRSIPFFTSFTGPQP